MERYKEGYVYHIKDEFFEKMDKEIPDNKLMANKENGNYRPTYYCTKDENTGLLWVVPMSTKFDKYQAEYDKQVARFGSCLKIVLGEFDQQKSAFLLQNMFPITGEYLDHVHTRSGKAIRVENDIQKTIRSNMKRLKELTKRGKKVTFTDFVQMEKIMLDELKAKQSLEEKIAKVQSEKPVTKKEPKHQSHDRTRE